MCCWSVLLELLELLLLRGRAKDKEGLLFTALLERPPPASTATECMDRRENGIFLLHGGMLVCVCVRTPASERET